MRVTVFVHENAHDDPAEAERRCVEYCHSRGWPNPLRLVARPEDPLSPDLGGVLLSAELGAFVVPATGDLLWGGIDMVRVRVKEKLTAAEMKLRAVREMHATVRDLARRRVPIVIVDDGLHLERADADRLADMLDSFAQTIVEWNENEREERSERSREALERARIRGVKLGRPRKPSRQINAEEG